MNFKVLVLNQNYEPLTICNVKRAIIMTFLGKAEIVTKRDGLKIHSVKRTFDCPSIVRLGYFVHVPYKRILPSHKNILKRDNHRCQYCGSTVSLTVDHIVPKSQGGEDTWENLVTACVKCNNKKGDKSLEESGMKLIHQPKKPSYITFMKSSAGAIGEDWKPFLYF
jgi:5-methylcytosine-specific restriction endonuclease McrA